jgi:TRAP-type uncharacterized transport system substrate-binding protein
MPSETNTQTVWRDRLTAALPAVLLSVAGIALALHFIDPAPPMHVAIAAGTDDSDYTDFARRYRALLANDGVTLDIQNSGGAVDNLQKLRNEDDVSQIAFVQDGLSGQPPALFDDEGDSNGDAGSNASSGSNVRLVSLGSVSYEPIWIFYRGKVTRRRLSELRGLRVAMGEKGSGTYAFAARLLAASGVNARNTHLINVPHAEAQQLLGQGRADAAFFMGAPDSALIRSLVQQPQLHIMDLDQAQAYNRQFPYLHALVLPHGSMDLAHNLPRHDLHLLATTTTVVVTENLHPALVVLLMKAMQKTHAGSTLLSAPREFPADKDNDFALSKDAAHFYQSGPPFLQRYLPFWLATLVDRAALAILPILAVLVPIVRTAPALYFWRLRRRIYRWYGELKYLEIQLGMSHSNAEQATLLRQLDHIEEKVKAANLPLAFTEHIYVLREHMDLVRRKLARPALQ